MCKLNGKERGKEMRRSTRLYTYEESLTDGQEVDNVSLISHFGVGQGGMPDLYSKD